MATNLFADQLVEDRVLIFDFDGTLIDSLDIAVEAYNAVAPRYRAKPIDRADLPRLRSSSFMKGLLRDYNVSSWKLPFIVRDVRREMKRHMAGVQPHPGLIEVLRGLKSRGHNLGILTSNSKENVEAFLALHHIADVFSFIISSGKIFGKHTALNRLIRDRNLSKDRVTYIGDEVRDIEAAKRAGVKSIAVTWGFQTREAFARISPDRIIDNPTELLS